MARQPRGPIRRGRRRGHPVDGERDHELSPLGSILQNPVSAENFSDQFFILKL
jgi:hypothetical protein